MNRFCWAWVAPFQFRLGLPKKMMMKRWLMMMAASLLPGAGALMALSGEAAWAEVTPVVMVGSVSLDYPVAGDQPPRSGAYGRGAVHVALKVKMPEGRKFACGRVVNARVSDSKGNDLSAGTEEEGGMFYEEPEAMLVCQRLPRGAYMVVEGVLRVESYSRLEEHEAVEVSSSQESVCSLDGKEFICTPVGGGCLQLRGEALSRMLSLSVLTEDEDYVESGVYRRSPERVEVYFPEETEGKLLLSVTTYVSEGVAEIPFRFRLSLLDVEDQTQAKKP